MMDDELKNIMDKKVSIILSTYNEAEIIEKQ